MPRFTIDVDERFSRVLEDLAQSRNCSKAEAVRAAVQCFAILQKQLAKKESSKLSITDNKDRVLKDIIVT